MIRASLVLIALAQPALADTLIAARTIPAESILASADLLIQEGDVPGGVSDPALLVGMEARVALYAGRPVREGDVGPPAVVERNQIVSLIYDNGLIYVATEGRALDRAGPGERIRVMNLTSRTTVTATIAEDGTAYVAQ